jgi:CMP-N-acetylneuraminic acid synthetase
MLNGLTVVALIPARGGSKGLPGKNLKKLAGKSLIERAVESAKGASDLIDLVVVSSDDDAILMEAQRAGALPHLRAAEAASDTATAADLLEDYFAGEENALINTDVIVVYLQPTSPMRNSSHVRQALDMMHANLDLAVPNPSVVSVSALEKSPYWTMVIDEGRLKPLFPDAMTQNRQDLPAAYVPNGALYLFRWSDFVAGRRIPTAGSSAFVMSADESVDIDTQADFDRAVALLEDR